MVAGLQVDRDGGVGVVLQIHSQNLLNIDLLSIIYIYIYISIYNRGGAANTQPEPPEH